jgi:hypothetical protein
MKSIRNCYIFFIQYLILSVISFFVWAEPLSPEAVVREYYQALQEKDFARAYQFISKGMRAGKDQAQWTQEIQTLFERGQVEIEKFSVSPGPISDQEAQVNSTVVSKDLINVNGVIEYNREYLVRENGCWKLDHTELIKSKIINPESKPLKEE